MSHYVGGFFKYLAAALILAFSASLGYSFFDHIAPANMPWFTLAAMGLTEFGLICWLAVFLFQRHHDAHKSLAFVMIFVCLIAVIFTDAMELARLFGATFFLAGLYFYGLIVLFCAHMLALVIDFFIGYFEKNSFHGRQHSPTPNPRPKNVQESGETGDPLEQMSFAQTGQIPFWSRMKVATEAFKGASKYRWTPTDIKSQLSQPAQQEAVQETQSQPISLADLERMAQLKHSDMFHLQNLLGKENYQALLRRLVQGQTAQQEPEAPTQSQSD